MTVTTSKCKVLIYFVINLLTIIPTSYGVRNIVLMSTNSYDMNDLKVYQKNFIHYMECKQNVIWYFPSQQMENYVRYNRKDNQIVYVKYIMLNTHQDDGYWWEEKDLHNIYSELSNFINDVMKCANNNGVMNYFHFIEELNNRESNLLSMNPSDIDDLEDYQMDIVNFIESKEENCWTFPPEETEDYSMSNNKKNQITFVKYILKNTYNKLWTINNCIKELDHFFYNKKHANERNVLSYSQVIKGKKYSQSTNIYDISYLEENYNGLVNYLQNAEDIWNFEPEENLDYYYLYNDLANQIEYVKYIFLNVDSKNWLNNGGNNDLRNIFDRFFYEEEFPNMQGVMSYTQVIDGKKYSNRLMATYQNLKEMLPSYANGSCKEYFLQATHFHYAGYFKLINNLINAKCRETFNWIAFQKHVMERLDQLKKCEENENYWYYNLKEDILITGEPIKSHALRNIANNRVPVHPKHYEKLYNFQNDPLPLIDFKYIDVSRTMPNELLIMAIIDASYSEYNYS